MLVLLEFDIYIFSENSHTAYTNRTFSALLMVNYLRKSSWQAQKVFLPMLTSHGSQLCQSDYEYRISLQSYEVNYKMALLCPNHISAAQSCQL